MSISEYLHVYYVHGQEGLMEKYLRDSWEEDPEFGKLIQILEMDLKSVILATTKLSIIPRFRGSWRSTIRRFIEKKDLSVTNLTSNHILFIDEYKKEVQRYRSKGAKLHYCPVEWKVEFAFHPFTFAEELHNMFGKELAIEALKGHNLYYSQEVIDLEEAGPGERGIYMNEIISFARGLRAKAQRELKEFQKSAILSNDAPKKLLVCGFCKKKGHVFKDCRHRKDKQKR